MAIIGSGAYAAEPAMHARKHTEDTPLGNCCQILAQNVTFLVSSMMSTDQK
jgi:hypothetical protein